VNALVALTVALAPVLAVVLLLRIAVRAQRTRLEAISHQVAVTDAIHRELGAIVAPTVTRCRSGAWQALIPVPFERPAAVERVVAIAQAILARLDPARADRIRIVLVPQARLTRYMPVGTNTIASASAPVTGSPRSSAPASMPKIGVQTEKASS
jgi:hypothetical protein